MYVYNVCIKKKVQTCFVYGIKALFITESTLDKSKIDLTFIRHIFISLYVKK